MISKLVIGLVGEMASGKGTSAEYIKRKYKASDYRFSDILRDILKQLFLENSRYNMASLSLCLRKTFGEDVLDKTIAEKIKKDNNKIIVVDGIRRKEDMNYLKRIPGFRLVYIETDLKIAYQRIRKRKENIGDFNKTWKEFQKEHQLETEKNISKIKKEADIIINNNKDKKNLYKQLDEIISKYLI